ncbi:MULTISPECIES: YfbK domain-containing protein [Olivibacter]|uniref:von Willebrand factor type A domain-containing protein n=2 Tax=Olivibacter TaxID=376469 RepID=A0ABV6HDE4_9SPHI|nr:MULTISPECIES: von Willebrand factor type A domain-containing protein [Olivibacter]QEK99252.1 DUF3520 domain-containing protein [Olivibacter sp. LS-1]
MNTRISVILLLFSLLSFKPSSELTVNGIVYNQADQLGIAGVSVLIEGTTIGTLTDAKGRYTIKLTPRAKFLIFSKLGFESKRVAIGAGKQLDVTLIPSVALQEITVVEHAHVKKRGAQTLMAYSPGLHVRPPSSPFYMQHLPSTEDYQKIKENGFVSPKKEPLSTFAVDVDGASYSNIRRFINNGQLPPKDAIRLEEMINYFQYNLPAPQNNEPVAIHTELSQAPWNPHHRLLRIALKAKAIDAAKLPPANLVFLIDVSGSMDGPNRLPLVKSSLKMLVDQLRKEDRVAIVTYAGTARIKLAPVWANEKMRIKNAIDELDAGGSTAGGAGLKMAYDLAREHFKKDGNNRIILASDGDFNVGPSSNEDMETLIEKERQSGVSLSVLGFGMVNLKDSKMELLANKGHGNYAYIDNLMEAKKAMISEFGATFFTVAKDVKMQVEFNPAKVEAYRLLGYENRLLNQEDFNNDQKLGGDMGTGHIVTAFYEIVPKGIKEPYIGSVDPLKYQPEKSVFVAKASDELLTVKFRYKEPKEDKSKMKQVSVLDKPMQLAETSDDFRFASAIAEFAMLLRNSDFKQQANYDALINRAKSARGADSTGYRAEFIRLAESAKLLAKSNDIAAKE